MKQFNEIKRLADELKNRGVCSKNFLIGIDGFLNAGKTCLAKSLNDVLGGNCINVIDIDDEEKDYYPRNRGSIIKYTNFNKLKMDIIHIQHKTSVIFSSACLLQILKGINTSPDIHIYVKRMAKPVGRAPDTWQDEYDCTFKGDINEWENNEISEALRFDSQTNTVDVKKSLMTKKEVVQYHQKYKPHENAEYYYIRYEK